MLRKRNEGFARGRRRRAADVRRGVPKLRTIWPGQHLRCGICNRIFYWGGHGQTERLITATQKAAVLHRIMQSQLLTDPYVELFEPAGNCTKIRRHRHSRYRFEPFTDGNA